MNQNIQPKRDSPPAPRAAAGGSETVSLKPIWSMVTREYDLI